LKEKNLPITVPVGLKWWGAVLGLILPIILVILVGSLVGIFNSDIREISTFILVACFVLICIFVPRAMLWIARKGTLTVDERGVTLSRDLVETTITWDKLIQVQSWRRFIGGRKYTYLLVWWLVQDDAVIAISRGGDIASGSTRYPRLPRGEDKGLRVWLWPAREVFDLIERLGDLDFVNEW
jgi:hypothetical protein